MAAIWWDQVSMLVLDALPTEAAVVDSQAQIVFVNRAWRQFGEQNNGRPESCFTGANYLEACQRAGLTGDEVAQRVAQGLTAVLAGTQPNFSCEYPCHSEDKQRWYHLLIYTLQPDWPGAVILHLDITERVLATKRLEEAETRSHDILNSITHGVVLTRGSGEIVQLNDAAAAMLGGEAVSLEGQMLPALLGPELEGRLHATPEPFGQTDHQDLVYWRIEQPDQTSASRDAAVMGLAASYHALLQDMLASNAFGDASKMAKASLAFAAQLGELWASPGEMVRMHTQVLAEVQRGIAGPRWLLLQQESRLLLLRVIADLATYYRRGVLRARSAGAAS